MTTYPELLAGLELPTCDLPPNAVITEAFIILRWDDPTIQSDGNDGLQYIATRNYRDPARAVGLLTVVTDRIRDIHTHNWRRATEEDQ